MSEEVLAHQIDRSKWSDGPWMTEPDRLDWIHAGYHCLISRHPKFGHLCGYVAVDRDNPLYGHDYSGLSVDVHGGLTYSNKCSGHICHVPQPGMPHDVWWLGFDCAHAFDLSPGRASLVDWPELRKPFGDTYRDLQYVTEETNRLADQLRVLAIKL